MYDRQIMRSFWKFYLLTITLVFSLCALLLWLVVPTLSTQGKLAAVPLPSFLTLTANAQVTTIDLWKPSMTPVTSFIPKPDITAKSAIAYDLTSNQLLFNSSSDTRLPMASLTKIMTAIVGWEHQRLDDKYAVKDSALVGEDSMGLDRGEILSLKELTYGLFLHSGNDAAEVIATNFPSGRKAFIDAMNQKAQSLGITDTHFTNPTGLEGDGDQYTTAYDLLVMTRYALMYVPVLAEIAQTPYYTIDATATHKEYYLESEINLLTTYPGVKGFKTGYTPEAGLCLVTYLDYKGHHIVVVILGSENRRDEMKEILDYSLRTLGVTPPQHG